MLFQNKGVYSRVFFSCQSVLLIFLTFPNYLRYIHYCFKYIYIREFISQSVLSFIQTFTIIKTIYLITVNLSKILQLQENYFFFLILLYTFVKSVLQDLNHDLKNGLHKVEL